jgi:hypothetical protein
MTINMKMTIQISVFILLALVWISIPAFATGNGHNDNNDEQIQNQAQHQGQAQGQYQTAESTATADASSYSEGSSSSSSSEGGSASAEGGSSSASNEGNALTVEGDTSNVENNSSNIVLVPNNNTEKCLRVWGIAWGRDGTSGALGVPWRSAACDFEQAADDAFAAGERELGWFWKCQNKNLYKQFKGKGESKESAKTDCLDEMVGGVTAIRTINTLTEKLTLSEELRTIERNRNTEAETRITEMCNESKNRLLAACTAK